MAGKKKKPNRKQPRKPTGKKPNVRKRRKPRAKSDDYVTDPIVSPFDQQRRRRPPFMGPPQPVNDDDYDDLDQGALGAVFEDFQELDAEDLESDAMSQAQKKRDDWTRERLKDIFNAEKWIDRTAEMKQKWKEITPEEKKLFDFAQAYSDACRYTLKRHMKSDGFDF